MFASTGTNGSAVVGPSIEDGQKPPIGNDESDDTATARSNLRRAVTDSDYFEAGQFGTYVSIFILLIGESHH